MFEVRVWKKERKEKEKPVINCWRVIFLYMYVCLCCWLSAQATMYVSREDATASPGIILIFVFVLSGICSLYSEHVETSPHNHHPYVCVVGYLPCSHCTWRMLKSHHISSSIFLMLVLSGNCPGNTVHGGCWNFTTYQLRLSSSIFLCLCCQVSALVTLYMSQEDAAAASDTLINAVNWYKKNKVSFCGCSLCVYVCLCCWLSAQAAVYVSLEDVTASPGIILIFSSDTLINAVNWYKKNKVRFCRCSLCVFFTNLLSLWINLWVKCLAWSKPHIGAMSLLPSVCDLFPCLKPLGICKPLCTWDKKQQSSLTANTVTCVSCLLYKYKFYKIIWL